MSDGVWLVTYVEDCIDYGETKFVGVFSTEEKARAVADVFDNWDSPEVTFERIDSVVPGVVYQNAVDFDGRVTPGTVSKPGVVPAGGERRSWKSGRYFMGSSTVSADDARELALEGYMKALGTKQVVR